MLPWGWLSEYSIPNFSSRGASEMVQSLLIIIGGQLRIPRGVTELAVAHAYARGALNTSLKELVA